MSNIKFVIHFLILLLIQLTILDNVQLHSYMYINIYILIIYILPYRLRNATILFFGFFLGLFIDLANNTMGIHAAATTLIAYIRPRLLMLTSNREQIDDIQGKQKISDFGWFFKYILISTAVFNVVLILGEAFSIQNFLITLLRIICSTVASIFFILLYYFIALKKKRN
ncbi:rod shape-determining protein MreD [Odoribacter sp. Z80]|uniref:rod shape-determining protein MreD n=1 Tax=Odoribacter sp. Z80 TaxID=2304575 RepID=UPI001379B602|nr:rod shape-determining protein MreD [Odoribacter sp. Z80]NCE71485.1 rod shape-determining protein MreD [Odoribacter sp. Z80]